MSEKPGMKAALAALAVYAYECGRLDSMLVDDEDREDRSETPPSIAEDAGGLFLKGAKAAAVVHGKDPQNKEGMETAAFDAMCGGKR